MNETAVRERLLDAALNCFLQDDYHRVSTRKIAAMANTNIAMIRYYFGNKAGLYEEMIRSQLDDLLKVLDGSMLDSPQGFGEFFSLYYQTMLKQPEFPRLLLKVLALNDAPGKRFVQQLLERGRNQSIEKIDQLQRQEALDSSLDADILRLSFVSLAMTPILLKELFEEQIGREVDADFLQRLADFNGQLFAKALTRTQ